MDLDRRNAPHAHGISLEFGSSVLVGEEIRYGASIVGPEIRPLRFQSIWQWLSTSPPGRMWSAGKLASPCIRPTMG